VDKAAAAVAAAAAQAQRPPSQEGGAAEQAEGGDGGDASALVAEKKDPAVAAAAQAEASAALAALLEEQSVVKFRLDDLDDGSYQVSYRLDDPGEALIRVSYRNEFGELVPIRGSPFRAQFAGDQKPDNNNLYGQAAKDYVKHRLQDIRDFIKRTNEDIDYKEKNLDDVKQVITIMAAIGEIARKYQADVLDLDVIEEMLRPLRKHHDTKELGDQ